MTINAKSITGTLTISAMDLRSQPGTILDNVYYRKTSIVVERAGSPRAVIVPVSEYQEFLRMKRETKERFFEMTDKLRGSFSDEKPEKVEKLIKEAIEARRKKAKA